MPTTQITTTTANQVAAEFYGDFGGDFDQVAVQRALTDQLEAAAQELVPSVTLTTTGIVYADVKDADAARAINWAALVADVDLPVILDRNTIA